MSEKVYVFVTLAGSIETPCEVGDRVTAQIDLACRAALGTPHCDTFAAGCSEEVVDDSISQAGSLVAFDRLALTLTVRDR